MLGAGLIASRFLHYIAVLSLFGAALYPLYTFRGTALKPDVFAARLRRLLWAAVAAAFVGGVGWFVFTTASMTGGISAVFDPAILRTMMRATDFGPLWALRLILVLIVAALLTSWPGRVSLYAVPVLAGLLLASLAGTGHTRATEGWTALVHIASDATHLLTAGLWIGGLWSLGFLIAVSDEAGQLRPAEVLRRFSGVATGAVAILVASGLVNGWFLVGSPALLVSTLYGQLLLVKMGAFLLMAGVATANRFQLTPRLDAGLSAHRDVVLTRLKLHLTVEQVLGVGVLAIVSLIGTLQPALP